MGTGITDILRLIRIRQYIKNVFIFLPLFFAGKITDAALLSKALTAFAAFSLTASAVYVLNDYVDMELDRRHPKKKSRPLASGSIGKLQAIEIMAFLVMTGFVLMLFSSFTATLLLVFYVLMNIAYSYRLKHVVMVDVLVIATGFVIRLFIGAVVTDVTPSMWIVVMTFLLALFLALAKRRDDVLIFMETGDMPRNVLDRYSLRGLDTALIVVAVVMVTAYAFYASSPEVMSRMHSRYLYLTALLVAAGVLRYLHITLILRDSGSPEEVVFRDPVMQVILLGWTAAFTWILYL